MSIPVKEQRKIDITEMPIEIPDFNSSFKPKDSLIKTWIIDWILSSISKKQIKENDILPSKQELSKHLGVSVGTVQNAIRYVEDEGFLKSKQRKGTMISNTSNSQTNPMPKSTTKRDKAVIAIKRAIIQNGYSVGKKIPSSRKMSEMLGISQNTTRLAYENLRISGILETSKLFNSDSNWTLKQIPDLDIKEIQKLSTMKADTLVDKVLLRLKEHLINNYNVGDKIPSHDEIAEKLNVSIKTVNDCIQKLNNEGILLSRRGRYGTVLAKKDTKNRLENEIFSSANDAAFYNYQKIETQIIKLINENYKVGEKIPSILELSKMFNVSTNTIRKAMSSLELDGYLAFSKGRYGGTFIVEKPDNNQKEQYQWISINRDFI